MGILGNLNQMAGRIGSNIAHQIPRMKSGLSSGATAASTRVGPALKAVGRRGQLAAARTASQQSLHRAIGYGTVGGAGALGYAGYRKAQNRRKSKPAYQSNLIIT